MATSGTTSATLSARQVVTAALEEIGAIGIGEAPSAEDAAKAMQVLGLMLKTWQTDGLGLLWLTEEVSITWPLGVTEVTLDTNYLDLRNVRDRLDSVDRMLDRNSASDYAEIPNKSQSGTPLVYNVLKTISTLALRIWPVPTVNRTIIAEGQRVIQDVTSLQQDLDIPQEWLETVYVCLAARLLVPYRIVITAPAMAAEIKERAASLYGRLSRFDEETESVFLGVAYE